MATKKIVVMTCDKCGTEDTDLTKFYHVTVEYGQPINKKGNTMTMSEKDLCESCIGQPGVNREL